MLNAVISGFADVACDVLRTLLLNPLALLVAVPMVVQRYAWVCCRRENLLLVRNPVSRTFGVGVIILQFFYAPYMRGVVGGDPVAVSLVLLIIDAFAQSATDLYEVQYLMGRKYLRNLIVTNTYQDITIKFRRMALVFWVQTALMGYFVHHVNNDNTMHAEQGSILKWLVALNLTQVTSNSEAGARFHAGYWWYLLTTTIPPAAQGKTDYFCECIPVPFKVHWTLRCLCDFFINGICRGFVSGIAPVYLAMSDDMEFIKDSLALFFITKLDDHDRPCRLGKRLEQERSKDDETADAAREWHLEWLLQLDEDAWRC